MLNDLYPATAPLSSPEHDAFRATVRRFVQDEVAPWHAQWERDGQVPKALWRRAGELGLLCLTMPEAYGGAGVDFSYSAIVVEELMRAGATGPLFYLHSDIVAPYLLHYGSEAQKQQWLPRMASGEVIGAIGMTEPGAGSDLAAIRTRADPHEGGWRINGQKIFISNGQIADLVLLAAKTDPGQGAKGVSLLLVETDGAEGFRRGRKLDKVGLKSQDTSELFFDDVRVPAANLLGGHEGQGFIQLMEQLPQERLIIALQGVAAMERALDETLAYVKQRKAFGKAIWEFQNTRFKLAEVQATVLATRAFVDACMVAHLAGELDAARAALAKSWVSEQQGRVMDECLQLFGGYGYMMEYPIAELYVDARVQRIYGGTNEIMKELASRSM